MKRHFDRKGKRIIREEIRINATPEQVWQAWADPQTLVGWFPDTAEGEAKPGGTLTMGWEKFGSFPYQVHEAIPSELLVLVGNGPDGRPFLLEIIIEKEGGETVLRLVNSGFREDAEWEDEYLGIVSGWKRSLHLLKHYLENYADRPRTKFLVIRPASFRFEQVAPYYQTADGLAHWLTVSGDLGALTLRDGGTVTGRVLALAQHETLLEWKEIEGVLQLTAFAGAGGFRALSVNGCSWAGHGPEKEPAFAAALDRLAALLKK